MHSHPRRSLLRPHLLPHFAGGLLALALLALVPFGVVADENTPPARGLHFADAPAQARQIVTDALAKYASTLPAGANVRIEPPLAGYDARNFPSGNLDADAKLYPRRRFYFPVSLDGKLVRAVEVRMDPTTGDLSLATIMLAPPPVIWDSVQKLAGRPEVQAGSFEVRLLYSSYRETRGGPVLWLKSTAGGSDLIYVMGGSITSMQPPGGAGVFYTPAEFVAGIHSEAQPTTNTPAVERRIAAAAATQERQKAMQADRNATIAENQRKAASGEDTNRNRLLALQAILARAVDSLQQATPAAKAYFAQPAADLIRAQASVARGLDYLKAHPEADRLVVQAYEDLGYRWSVEDNTDEYGVADLVIRGFRSFMGSPSSGIVGIGEIGPHRDRILRDVGLAEIDLGRADEAFLKLQRTGASSAPPVVSSPLASTNVPAHSGSISGTVVGLYGQPARRAVVFCMAVASPNVKISPGRGNGILPGVIPCTISDADGNFVIRDLPPGFYLVTGESKWTVVEVSEGKETLLPELLEVQPRLGGAGGG